jgi:methionine S-methyltransferase
MSSDEMMKQYHFSFSELKLKNMKLRLLRLPSTFAPEEWSYTFYEGLSRYKTSEFEDRKVVELGCGIGWISIALAMENRPKKIYGLDINPRAITCARINLFLNAYDHSAQPIWQSAGQNLDDIVEFHVSDLFEYCRELKIAVDRVIGCIPQVLNPDPDFTARMLKGDVSENASDEFLHSLSNYAPRQGQIEDQFGLGLIAKAVEDSVFVLKGTGKIILNLGGRPGKKVLQQLFLRRGFRVRQVWQTQVEQAKDTDIGGLVEIEKRSTHRFEFYVEQGGDTPISAHTALAYAKAGGKITHGLMVYEAELRDPSHLPQVIKTLGRSGFEESRNALDLSYDDDRLVEEKSSFLSALSLELDQTAFFPYQKTSGFESFRLNLALFFKNYFRISFCKENFVIVPSRWVICRNIISIYKPKRILIDSQLVSNYYENPRMDFPNKRVSKTPDMYSYLTDCEELIEIPQGSDLLCEMIANLKPDIVFYSMPEEESRTSDALLRIIEVSFNTKVRLIIDISELFELSSTAPHNGVFRFLENFELPSHVVLICGLVKNKIYSDLQVCFVVSDNKKFLEQITNAAELTYSRTPFLSQFYYNCILNDLLNFQVFEDLRTRQNIVRKPGEDQDHRFIQIAQSVEEAFLNPAIKGERQAQENKNLIRLDYGENCLPAPPIVKQLLFESFSHQTIPIDDCDPTEEIIRLNSLRWSFANTNQLGVLCAGGVAPIFSEIASHCARSNERMIFPCGSYGYFIASATFHGALFDKVQTDADRGFKVNINSLNQLLLAHSQKYNRTSGVTPKATWIILSAPIINPTGAIYSTTEIKEIVEVAVKHNAILVLDSIFSGLSFYRTSQGSFEEDIKIDVLGSCRWLILGGVSKEFAAGGLRIGYVISQDSKIINTLKGCELTNPHRTITFVLKKIYNLALANEQSSTQIDHSLVAQRKILKERSESLTELLTKIGWRVLDSRGGLFLIATPEKLLGKKIDGTILRIDNFSSILREHTGIIINSPEWIGIPNYFRFVLSVTEVEFRKALVAIENFCNRLK